MECQHPASTSTTWTSLPRNNNLLLHFFLFFFPLLISSPSYLLLFLLSLPSPPLLSPLPPTSSSPSSSSLSPPSLPPPSPLLPPSPQPDSYMKLRWSFTEACGDLCFTKSVCVCVCVCRFAGILLGITNTFATIPGMVGPVIASQLTKSVRKCSICIHTSSSSQVFSVCTHCHLINPWLRLGLQEFD